MMAALTCIALQRGWAARTSAATPAAWGVAIDVPLKLNPSLPVAIPAEKTVWPGAVTSGLRSPVTAIPRELNGVIAFVVSGWLFLLSDVRALSKLTLTVRCAASCALIEAPADFVMRVAGMA